jgi:MYXO-CTERM domain-containing protein
MRNATRLTAACLFTAAAAGTARADSIGPVFMIAMENHNWTQPSSQSSPAQLYGNPAAPYINSLVTPGNANSQYVSYCANYLNAGPGIHPSEPNYVWAEAGSNLGNATDNDPSAASGNIYTSQHLTGLLNGAGVSWRNYQEDSQVSGTGPTHSSSGTLPGGAVNPYYGTGQYNYAPKHNPMVFFSDTQTQNVATMSQLQTDLSSHNVAQYNWITPNQFNDQHSALSGGFTYQGTHYTGDTAAIAQGDNFLSIVVPLIMQSDAFQNHNGTIVIWNDETEGGDDPTRTSMEIVISKLAKGNAYASVLQYSHSSDVKTMQELYNVGANTQSGFLNDAANATDLADLFVPGALPNAGSATIPTPGSLALIALGGAFATRRRR